MKQAEVRYSTIGSYAHAIAAALESRDIDPRAVFNEAGVEFVKSSDPLVRLDHTEVARLFEVSTRLTADPYFGIQVGQMLQPGNLHALGYALMSSSTSSISISRSRDPAGLPAVHPITGKP